jgi:hypothetical protein
MEKERSRKGVGKEYEENVNTVDRTRIETMSV